MAATYSDISVLAYVAASINGIVLIIAVVVAVITLLVIKNKGIEEIHKAGAIFPTALESINYSEIPIAIVGVIAEHMQIPYEEVAKEYANDAAQRKVVVLNNFRKDPVTDRFIDGFPSKFVQHGYVGEELLQSNNN